MAGRTGGVAGDDGGGCLPFVGLIRATFEKQMRDGWGPAGLSNVLL